MKSQFATWVWRKYKDIENNDAFIVETAQADPFVICQVCPWTYDDDVTVNKEHAEQRAGLIASAPMMLATLKFILSQEHLFFAECEQAERILTDVRKAVSIATTSAMTFSGVPSPLKHKRTPPQD